MPDHLPEMSRAWWRKPSRARTLAMWGIALGAIVLGFADLYRGGVTVAPVLLILGYCVFVPAAILS